MTILGCSDLTVEFGDKVILDGVSFSINEGDILAINGVNKAGKTTLIKALTGEIEVSGGSVFVGKDKSFGIFEQNIQFDSDSTLYDEVLELFDDLVTMESELNALNKEMETDKSCINRFLDLNNRFIESGGLEYKNRINAVLSNLGFSQNDYDRNISDFSGGQKTQIALARVILKKNDILFLDEPTNNLDSDSINWLINYLQNLKCTIVLVSHNRYFVEKIANRILDIEYSKATMYNCGYEEFIDRKRRNKEIQNKHFLIQQREIKRIEEAIERYRRWGREKSIKKAESMEKRIERMDIIEDSKHDLKYSDYSFSYSFDSGNEVLSIYELTKKFGDNTVIDKFNYKVFRNDRICIVGKNGTGKSTLLKILTGSLPQTSGYYEYGKGVEYVYFDQNNSGLDMNSTVIDYIYDRYPTSTQTEIRNRLALFNFKEDDVFKRIDSLSGGERFKLSLCVLSLRKCNLLIFDEPTNNLDIDSCEILENAIQTFEGTVIAVSHDLYFVKKIANRIIEFSNDIIRSFDYGFDDYMDNHLVFDVDSIPVNTSKSGRELYDKKKKAEAEERKNRNMIASYKNEMIELESALKKVENEIDQTTEYDYVALSELVARKNDIESRLMEIYAFLEENKQSY